MAVPRVGELFHDGHRLVYDEYGEGTRTVVLLHGLLLSRRLQASVARPLAERAYRVVCLDLLGHGGSDRPPDMGRYSMPVFGAQRIALLDHLGVERAVGGGTSLCANATLEALGRGAPGPLLRPHRSATLRAVRDRGARSSSPTDAIPSTRSPTRVCSCWSFQSRNCFVRAPSSSSASPPVG